MFKKNKRKKSMSVLSDHWIKKMSLEKKMINPFVQKQQRKNKKLNKKSKIMKKLLMK